MRIFRDNCRAVALVAAIFMALGGGIAEAAIALHGPNPQFPLCGPQRTEFPTPPADRATISDHCDICPLTGMGPAIEVPPYEAIPDWTFVIERSGPVVAERSVARPELRPIVGRGPPLRN
jgi:hypothetical protein